MPNEKEIEEEPNIFKEREIFVWHEMLFYSGGTMQKQCKKEKHCIFIFYTQISSLTGLSHMWDAAVATNYSHMHCWLALPGAQNS